MKFKTVAVVTFGVGTVLGLTAAQARARSHLLKPVAGRAAIDPANPDKPAWFELSGTTQFKVGEEFIYDGELPKSLADALQLPNGVTVAEAVQKQEAAKADARKREKASAKAKK